MKPTRRRLAGLALTTAVLTGLITAIGDLTTPADTAWGAPDTTKTPVTITRDGISVTLLDTAWG